MLFILVQVICGVKLLRSWYGRMVPELITIADLFDMVQMGSFGSDPVDDHKQSKGTWPPGQK